MKKTGNIRRVAAFLLAALLFAGVSATVRAAEDTKIVGTFADEDTLKVYVKNAPGTEASYQIGNRAGGEMKGISITEDDAPLRTLILLDNSNSVAKQSKAAVSLVQEIISSHSEGEQLRVATIGDSITYLTEFSDDYLSLYNAASGITFQSQNTHLTELLIPVLKDLASDSYGGLTRIVIIADGVDDETLGSTRAELMDVLQKRSFPIYTVGVRNGTATSDADLSTMFSLSRMTNASTAMLEENGGHALISELQSDSAITVYRAQIPEEAKDGSTPNVQLTFSDGTKLSAKIDMPFGSMTGSGASTQETTQKDSSGKSTSVSTVSSTGSSKSGTGSTADSASGNSLFSAVPLWTWILIGAGVLLLLIVLIVVLASRGKKKSKNVPPPVIPVQEPDQTVSLDFDKTEIFDEKAQDYESTTEILFVNNSIQITLEDTERPACTFTETMNPNGQIIVGRSTEKAQIAVTYDKSVAREQCRLYDLGGQLHVENMSGTNITKLNDKPVMTADPVYHGDCLTFGRVKMRVSIRR
ncbi:MAG: VWA domain-containing protein [Lachnospiraceae bacterium]|nr:VWA domain-containing protein [Lachnospiraceae bacterium]